MIWWCIFSPIVCSVLTVLVYRHIQNRKTYTKGSIFIPKSNDRTKWRLRLDADDVPKDAKFVLLTIHRES